MDESISLRELVDVDIIQAIQDSFAKTVGVSSVIFLPDGDALTRFSNPTKFCSLIQSTKEGRRRCFQSFTEMSRKAVELSEPEIMYCFAYGAHFVAPIIIDGERKATMYAGQFRPENFSPEQLKELKKIAVEIDLDPEPLARAATNMHIVGEDVVWGCLHSFFRTVKAIAELGAQALELRQTKDTLQKAHDELGMRVQERTAELTETNEELRQEIAERKSAEGALRESEQNFHDLVENLMDGVAIADENAYHIYVNPKFSEITGYSRDELLNMTGWAFTRPEDRVKLKQRMEDRMVGKPFRTHYDRIIVRKDKTEVPVEMSTTTTIWQGKKRPMAIIHDITERKQAEWSLLEAKAELKHIIEIVPGIIAKVNAHTGYFTYCNPALSSILGFSPEELLARPFIEFIHPEDRQTTINEVEKQLKGNPLDMFENRYICKNGSYKWLEWRATASDEKEVIYAAATDITERKRAEDALRESEGKLRSIVEQSGDGIVLVDEQGTIIEWNPGQERITGLSRAEVLGRYMWDVQFRMAAADRATSAVYARVKAGVLKFLKTGQSGRLDKLQKTVIKRPDGARRVIQVAVFHIKTDKGFMAGAISRDITELSRAEDALRKSEEKYRALFETAKDAIFLSDEVGKFVDVNQAACESLGYSREELVRLSNKEIDADPTGYEAFLNVRNALAEEAVFEVNQQRKDGTLLPVEITGKFFKIDGELLSLAIARDITGRKAAEEQIKRSLREKDVLMHEMHHRVKNNLQVASSLLSMQARTTRNKEAIDVLSKSRNRINTMALIHTQLYESGDLSELNMKEFVGILSEELFRSYPVTDTKITHIVRMTDRKFPISVGMYVGLIINELLSNAIEHAFGEMKEGTIKVSLTASDGGRVNLSVSDDGIGLPPGFDIDKTGSLGLHLVKILVEDQLQGILEVTSDGGATFNMEFDLNDNGGSSYGEDKTTDR